MLQRLSHGISSWLELGTGVLRCVGWAPGRSQPHTRNLSRVLPPVAALYLAMAWAPASLARLPRSEGRRKLENSAAVSGRWRERYLETRRPMVEFSKAPRIISRRQPSCISLDCRTAGVVWGG